MTTSTVLGLPYIAAQQASPEITHNEALYMLEALLRGVKDRINAPPGAPVDGDSYLITAGASGAWSGWSNHIAIRAGNAWRFVPGFDTSGTRIPIGADHEGMRVFVIDEDAFYQWSGAAWVSQGSGPFVAKAGDTMTGPLVINLAAFSAPAAPSDTIFHLNGLGTGFQSRFLVDAISNDTRAVWAMRRARDAGGGSPGAVQSGDSLGAIGGFGYGATAYSPSSRGGVDFEATENWTDTAQGTRTGIRTTANGSSGSSIRLYVQLGVWTLNATGGDQGIDTINTRGYFIDGNAVADSNRLIRRRVYTFGTLPAAGTNGRYAQISDGAAAPVWGAAAAGGGAVQTPVFDNGAAWTNG
jgi:hypothetical protein